MSEGMWFLDSAEDALRGVVVAIEMPVDLFLYRSEVQGNEIVHDLVARGDAGGTFVERWPYDDDGYRWSLEQEKGGAAVQIMSGAYRRSSEQ